MTGSVRQRLTESLDKATSANKALASYMLANLGGLPFETSATLAAKVGVSEPTVGRFCRSLGYAHFKELKEDLRDSVTDRPWLAGERLKEFRKRSHQGDALARSLDLEIAALLRIYEIAKTDEWQRAAKRLATVPNLFVGGFQTERGMARYFADQMHYLRPGVHMADVAGGNFSEILLAPRKSAALVLFEARRYSRLTLLLAQEAHQVGIPITLITDAYCDWGRGLADEMFVVPTEFGMFWDSTAQMASLGNLLINSVFSELDVSVEERMNKVAALHGKFIGFTGER